MIFVNPKNGICCENFNENTFTLLHVLYLYESHTLNVLLYRLPAASGIFNVEDKEIKSLLKSEEYEIFSNINLPFHEVPENSANYLLTLAKKISSTQELCHYLATMPWGDEVYNIEMHYNLRVIWNTKE
ncbi:10561_t:CDS:2 [Entrophospora sp. SA101]|nr:10561_t:CDS:2 [Entrophospora sp. SA101]